MNIELHAHTSEGSPCGLITTFQLLQAYHAKGADALVLTDHYSMNIHRQYLKGPYTSTYQKARQYAQELSIRLFLGMEINLLESPNDYLLYGLSEAFYDAHPKLYLLDLASLADLVHREHGLIFQAHPLRSPCQLCDPMLIDGLEFNTSPFHDNHNDQLYAWAKTHLNRYSHLRFITGSDCHGLENIGSGMQNLAPAANDQQLVQSLLASTFSEITKKNSLFR